MRSVDAAPAAPPPPAAPENPAWQPLLAAARALIDAVARLDAPPQDAAGAARLAEARLAADHLSACLAAAAPASPPAPEPDPAAAADIDHARFYRLLEIAGPRTAQELLARLAEDLTSVRTGLHSALPAPDWDALRRHSHVLVSLAGAVGATRLQDAAEQMNAQAHRADVTDIALRVADLSAQITRLLHFVAAQTLPAPPAAPGKAAP